MTKRHLFRRPFTFALLAIAVVGCGTPKRPPVLADPGAVGGTPAQTQPAETTTTPAEPINEGPDVRAVEAETPAGSDIASAAGGDSEGGPLADVRFELDSAELTEAARAILEKHAAWLQGHRDVKLVVEGHADERGTVEYNLALGEHRARTARDYLASLGVAGERMRVTSYGKERPLDPTASEEAYAKNRRAHFAVAR